MTCPACGLANPEGAAFCNGCGSALEPRPAPVAAAATATADTTAEPSTQAWATASGIAGGQSGDQPNISAERFFGGDWAGALLASMAWFVAVLVVCGASEALLLGGSGHASLFISRLLAFVALAAGGAATGVRHLAFGDGYVAQLPMTASLLGFGLLGLVFARRLKRQGADGVDVVMQGVRVILVMALLLVIVGFAAHHGGPGHPGSRVRVKVAFTAFFGACVTLLSLLLAVTVSLSQVLPARVWDLRRQLLGPLVGVLALAAAAIVIGDVFVLVQILAVPHHLDTLTVASLGTGGGRRHELGRLLATGPNVGVWLLMLGSGMPLHDIYGNHDQAFLSLSKLTDHSAWYWFLLPAAALIWAKGASVAALYAASPREGRKHGYRFMLVAPVFIAAAVVLSGVAFHQPPDKTVFRLHFEFWPSIGLALIWAAVAGVAMPTLVLKLPVRVIVMSRNVLVRRFGGFPAHQPAAPAHAPVALDEIEVDAATDTAS